MPTEAGLQPLTGLPGVGPALRETLARLGMTVLQDLWFHLPLRYEDRTRLVPIADLREGESAQVEGVVDAVQRGFRGRPQLRVALSDGSQETLVLRFFHFRGAQADQLKPGARLRCYGEVRRGQNSLEMVHPQYQRLVDDAPGAVEETLTPVYPITEGLGQRRLGNLIQQALQRLPDDDALELIPDSLRAGLELASLREALLFVHRPPPDANVAQLLAGVHPAQQRLAFEELLSHHLSLRQLRNSVRRQAAQALTGDGHLRRRLLAALPYALTAAQRRVGGEIAADLRASEPMLRLVQGDVGSGKTVVAALAALSAVEAGHQAALMAPTELLAEQHLRTLRGWLEPLGVEVVWLAGKVQGRARKAALEAVAGGAGVVVGTHALMQEGVAFRQLGLAIIDEQHRFGVAQRLALRQKLAAHGMEPHMLMMSATPIPRTLAMSYYADLDVSVIDELPPGRTPIVTKLIADSRKDEVIARIGAQVEAGRQVYWVCPLIEESAALDLSNATATHADLSEALPGCMVCLLHSRMPAAEKKAVMALFTSGQMGVLVSTTVIEVGVDVPNASLMVIEHAERFGLSQLHQLRGRVGRGAAASACVLLYATNDSGRVGETAKERLRAMAETNDGFEIARRDLEIRGPGEFLGARQSGDALLRFADLATDTHLLEWARELAPQMLDRYPDLAAKHVARWLGGKSDYLKA